MDGDPADAAAGQIDRRAPGLGDGDDAAEQRAGGGGAEGDRDRGLDQQPFLFDPEAAGVDFGGAGLGMDAAGAALFIFEMLDRVGDIGAGAIDAGGGERAIEQLPGGADERAAGQILLIAGLFADEHQPRIGRPLAEHGLRGGGMERAARAAHGFLAQCFPPDPGIAADIGMSGGDHAMFARLRAGDQIGDERGFGHVLPVFLRHFLRHRADLHAGGIEDRGVIGLPGFLQRIAVGRVGGGGAGREGERDAVPVHRQRGRQDRPVHGGEAAREEIGVEADDVIVGFEPGDVARRAIRHRQFAEADEGAHLVHVAPDILGHPFDPPDQRIGLIAHQAGLRADADQQGVEQREAFGIAVAERGARQIDERARHGEGTGGGIGGGFVPEQIGRSLAHLPDDILRRDPRKRQRARGGAPSVEIILAGQRCGAHQRGRRMGGGWVAWLVKTYAATTAHPERSRGIDVERSRDGLLRRPRLRSVGPSTALGMGGKGGLRCFDGRILVTP